MLKLKEKSNERGFSLVRVRTKSNRGVALAEQRKKATSPRLLPLPSPWSERGTFLQAFSIHFAAIGDGEDDARA